MSTTTPAPPATVEAGRALAATRRRRALGFAVAVAALLVCGVLSLAIGSKGLSVDQVIAALGVTSLSGTVWCALLGAVIATFAVYAIGAAGRGGPDPLRVTLAGVAIGAFLGGMTSGITLLLPEVFNRMRGWNAGSISAVPGDLIPAVLPFLVVGFALAAVVAGPLNAIALGDELAVALGSRVVRTRILSVVAVTLLCGTATAAAGPIGFVGLMVPHAVRWFTGPDQRWILAGSAVAAPVLLLSSDIVGRLVMRGGELPVGIVTAFVGAPVLIALVRRRKASGL